VDYLVVTQSVLTTLILAGVVYFVLRTLREVVVEVVVGAPKEITVQEQGTGVENPQQIQEEVIVTPQKTNFYPDVEMDEWMNEFGMPNTPGWGGPETTGIP
jgi:hypothetical protein